MGERYSKLFSLPENLYAVGSPVIIAAGALLKDNHTGKILAQLKIRNISRQQIKAVTVAIQPKDTVGISIGDITKYQYLDLNEERDKDFGQKTPIPVPDATTRTFSAVVSEVIFADDSQWYGTEKPWEPLAEAIELKKRISDPELIKQYKLELGQSFNYIYTEVKDLWLCGCGSINHKDEGCCHSCQTEVDQLRDLDWNALKLRKEERLDEDAELAKAEQERATAITKKTRKILLIGVVSVIAIIAGSILTTKVLIPGNMYRTAEKLLENGQYQEAIDTFETLDGYKDSLARIDEAKDRQQAYQYDIACKYLENKEYQEAVDLFREIENYRESEEKLTEARYYLAMERFRAGDYKFAAQEWEEMGNYLDSKERCIEALTLDGDYGYVAMLCGNTAEISDLARYAIALNHMENKHFEDALSVLEEFDDGSQVSEAIKEHVYQYAVDILHSIADRGLDYTAPLRKFFMTLGDYKDAAKIVERFHPAMMYNINQDGTVYDEFAYGPQGELAQKNCRINNAYYTLAFGYDENKRIIAYSKDSNSGSKYTYFLEYDEDGRIIKQDEYNSSGEVFSTFHYEYQEDGLLSHKQTVYSTGTIGVDATYRYEYDSQGRVVKRIDHVTYWDGDLSDYTYDFTYNNDGTLATINKSTCYYSYIYLESNEPLSPTFYINEMEIIED